MRPPQLRQQGLADTRDSLPAVYFLILPVAAFNKNSFSLKDHLFMLERYIASQKV